ncbi:serine protease SPPA, chloroplastic-like [Phoenix dactylifera]|uniref:Serine protease SPPA, chloroplastic-like n=1 Tax=Phoenix dactylifera TaxID=42345 RepID=A0A8B8ZUM5_PHODC|nr:serine protease SPPA, chloroplastic-like [Phoenix dactylifera]
MSKILLLKPPHGQLHALNHSASRRNLSAFLASSSFKPPLSPLLHFSPSLPSSSSRPPPLRRSSLSSPRRIFPVRALESSSTARTNNEDKEESKAGGEDDGAPPSSPSTAAASGPGDGVLVEKAGLDGVLPTGEFEMEEFGWWKSFVVKLRMLFAFPWERVKKGSVLTMKLRGQISDQLKSRFASGLSLPKICENFIKAAYDPRISGIYLQIEPLSCGWGKLDEIRRHILDFKKSGKFIVSYVPICGEKEYYLACACGELYVPPGAYVALFGLVVQSSFLGGVLEKVGIEPHIQRIGKYKSAGDQLSRKSMSKEVCEMLTSLLDSIYGNWLDTISSTQGKTREEIEEFINTGVYQVEKLKEEGWITNTMYDDEVMSMLKERLGQKDKKNLLSVDYSKYSRVRKWTLGLEGKEQFAIIRASGSISRTRSPLSIPSSGIVGEQLIEKIRTVRDTKRYKAVILRIDSPGGDALASDLMWREIKLLAASKPVIVSMSDVAASGGYYMAMAAETIVAENLTLTGSIGVVTGKFSLNKLYERIGFNKEIISRGRFAELNAADQRPLRPDEAELFAKSAQNIYRQFRDKAAFSRSMSVDQMEEVAQGRVWSGKDAASRGLVDAIGGFSRAVAIAKHRANIPQDSQVKLVEVSRPSPSLPEILSGIGNSLFGLDQTVKGVLQDLTSANGVQARMDGILFESLENALDDNAIFRLIKEYQSSF